MYLFVKRAFDVLCSLILVIVLLPLLLPISALLLVTGEHYVFYLQQRRGYKNRCFNIIKFATMLKNSPNIGTGMITLRNDSRLLPFGKFLRKSKINELPQIINVLKGDMSLVGPRPLVDKNFNCYPEHIKDTIYNCKPGITGIGSIVFRDEESLISSAGGDPHQFYKEVIAPYKGAVEIWYQLNQSFFLDLKILFFTVWVIVFPQSKLISKAFKGLPERPVVVFNPIVEPV